MRFLNLGAAAAAGLYVIGMDVTLGVQTELAPVTRPLHQAKATGRAGPREVAYHHHRRRKRPMVKEVPVRRVFYA
ncbi:hypothetical protein SAMN05216548_10531 [Faunimonas pinastri]|uniref:Uncharacterized protein n=1 Tax=Faunimonas pinastri TaxID=1855383 RepID=A0A1H9GGG6_9HYPH|nr:hypothetical protein [Faunimonas pinastri]SEQ49149.1 hypothetical protein SAMN05216548_10531 [Faunimonas pinastri]